MKSNLIMLLYFVSFFLFTHYSYSYELFGKETSHVYK